MSCTKKMFIIWTHKKVLIIIGKKIKNLTKYQNQKSIFLIKE